MALDVEDADRRREAEEKDHEQRVRHEKEFCRLRLDFVDEEQKKDMDRLQKLKSMGVDLTKVLVSERAFKPESVDKVISAENISPSHDMTQDNIRIVADRLTDLKRDV